MKLIDLTGKVFGEFLVLRRGKDRLYLCGEKQATWECRCSCGAKVEITGQELRNGTVKVCRCFSPCPNKPDDHTPFRYFLGNAKRHITDERRSKASKIVSITVSDLKEQWERQKGICPYTGWKLSLQNNTRKRGERCPEKASLDRIDNSQGYVKGNVQFVAQMANYAKNSFDGDALVRFCKAVALRYSDTKILSQKDHREIGENIEALTLFEKNGLTSVAKGIIGPLSEKVSRRGPLLWAIPQSKKSSKRWLMR